MDECLIFAESGKLREPVIITVKKTPGVQWPTISKYSFPEKGNDDTDIPEKGNDEIDEDMALLYAERAVFEAKKEIKKLPWINLDEDPDVIEERLAIMEVEDLPF